MKNLYKLIIILLQNYSEKLRHAEKSQAQPIFKFSNIHQNKKYNLCYVLFKYQTENKK